MSTVLLIYLIGAAATFLFFVVINWISVSGYKRVGLFVVLSLATIWPHTWWLVAKRQLLERKLRRDRK